MIHSYSVIANRKLWYAGAYTVQMDTVPVDTGRQVPFVQSPGAYTTLLFKILLMFCLGWLNNAILGVATPIIVDGAKRDRSV